MIVKLTVHLTWEEMMAYSYSHDILLLSSYITIWAYHEQSYYHVYQASLPKILSYRVAQSPFLPRR